MKMIVINENQRGLFFRNGKFVRVLEPGKYVHFGTTEILVSEIGAPVPTTHCPVDVLLKDAKFASMVTVKEVGNDEILIHSINGKVDAVISTSGKHAFWNCGEEHRFITVDFNSPEISEDFPKYALRNLPETLYTKIEISEYQKGRLYYDNRFVRMLEPGTYYFWNNGVKVKADTVDTRLTKMEIVGQEIMTSDKVALRINFVCNYRVTDYLKIAAEVDNYKEQMHIACQLALRDYVGKYKLDEILENKDGLSSYVASKLKEKEDELFVEIKDAGVKDIILPGEIRAIMNTVLIAEKKAQANVITRREEVASTRSLLNTAKLMDENETLYKLKELEYVERIFENVGNITVNGNGDILSELVKAVGCKKPA